MKANLIVSINELTIKDYSLLEDEGLGNLMGSDVTPNVSMAYEDDRESPGKHMIVIKGKSLEDLFKFLDFTDIVVKIVA
jgi:hypothetical protein